MSEENQASNSQPLGLQPEDTKWQRDTIEKLATSALSEQKTARRWSTFFKGLMFAYLFTILFFALGWFDGGKGSIGKHTALIEVSGVIEAGGDVNADSFMSSLHDAYDDKGTKGIILRINSPGGSPVQAGIINEEIRRQKALQDVYKRQLHRSLKTPK